MSGPSIYIKVKEVKIMKCPICGVGESRPCYEGACSKECHHTLFWRDIVSRPENRYVVGNKCYYVDKEPSRPIEQLSKYELDALGFAGQCYSIQLLTDPAAEHIVITHNLWCVGTVPEDFKEALPADARFVWPVKGVK